LNQSSQVFRKCPKHYLSMPPKSSRCPHEEDRSGSARDPSPLLRAWRAVLQPEGALQDLWDLAGNDKPSHRPSRTTRSNRAKAAWVPPHRPEAGPALLGGHPGAREGCHLHHLRPHNDRGAGGRTTARCNPHRLLRLPRQAGDNARRLRAGLRLHLC